ncbi:MAG: cyclic pyranopterin monophosphate synthase MoaC [Rhodobacterales bacterium]|jgi:cyclic pyranopterin phosphate synthase|tara:strand:- start:548 stop:1027 length:480 start_codon:yes stop_codon:yes gene_type:complete
MTKLTHLNDHGQAHMVDIASKVDSDRTAIATGSISMKKETLELITKGNIPKGDVLTVARIAGIMGAKKTSELIPLCHPLPLSKVDINLSINDNLPGLDVKATVRTFGKTGVEMEALTGVSITALTIYDMVKAVDKTMSINKIILTFKDGGKSGRFEVKP